MRHVSPIHGRDHQYGRGDDIPGIPHIISQELLAAPRDTIVIDDIPPDFAFLVLKLETATTDTFFSGEDSNAYGGMTMTFNDDTGGNYTFNENTLDLYDGFLGNTAIIFGTALADIGILGAEHTHISNYQQPMTRSISSHGSVPGGDFFASPAPTLTAAAWLNDTDPITKITLSALGDFVAGTQYRLYGQGHPGDMV